jgi:hypothetical protein
VSAPVYEVRAAAAPPDPGVAPGAAPGGGWEAAAEGRIAAWHPRSGAVRPDVRFRALRCDGRLHARFDVLGDRLVRSVATEPQGPVWKDSCVEFFVQPAGAAGHFNFEMNAGGTLHSSYIVNPRRLPGGGYADWMLLPAAALGRIRVRASLPRRIDPALPGPVDWCVALEVPLDLLEKFAGVPCRPEPGDEWRGNFFHCGDETPSPRWGAWSGVGERLDFHQPERFGVLRFA